MKIVEELPVKVYFEEDEQINLGEDTRQVLGVGILSDLN